MRVSEVPAALQGQEMNHPTTPRRAGSSRPDSTRHYSGVVVVAGEGALPACAEALDGMEGVEVHLRHDATSRLIAVLEGASVAQHEAHLERIRTVPGVLMAGLVYHYVDEDPDGGRDDAAVRREGEETP